MIPFKFRSEKSYALVQYELADKLIIPIFGKENLKNKKILDLGCGQGGATNALADCSALCIGLDLGNKFIKLNNKANFTQANAHHIPFKDDSFDIIIMQDILEHVKGTEQMLKEAKRVLKDKGTIYATFPPFYFPYAGHLWNLTSKIKYVPFAHLLPKKVLYPMIRGSKSIGIFTPEQIINDQETFSRLTIQQFEDHCKKLRLKLMRRTMKLNFTSFDMKLAVLTKAYKKMNFLYHIPLIRELLIPFTLYLIENEKQDN